MRRLDAIIDWIFRWHRVLLFASVIVVFLSLFLSGRAGAQELVDVTVPVSPLPGLSNAQLWVIVAPILIVVFGTFLRNLPPQTPDLTKRLIVGAAAAILAAGGLYAEGRLDFANWFGTFLTILFLAGGYFAILWKPFQDGVIFKIRETAVKVSGPDQGKVVDTGA